MPTIKENTTDLKIFLGLGIAALVFLFCAPVVLIMYAVSKQPVNTAATSTQSVAVNETTNGHIGELGSTCGGRDRLPCRPGLDCSTGTDFSKTGVCEKSQGATGMPADQSAGPQMKQLSEGCGTDYCAPGLFCDASAGEAAGACRTGTATAPNVLRIKLNGAEHSAGRYLAAAGDRLKIEVQTVNADNVKVFFIPSGDTADWEAVAMKKGTAGVYQGLQDFTVKSKMEGNFMVQAFKGASFAALELPFATKE